MTDGNGVEGAAGDGEPDRCEVAVIGGGPAGCSAAVFTARYGLEAVVFDRGNSSLRRCAYLENYLGFPGGVDIETFYGLIHDHAREAGCEIVPDVVETVEECDGDARFRVETVDGRSVAAEYVIAATRYGGEYLRPLGGEAMFEEVTYHGETTEQFDADYPDDDGSTPIDGLYVAAPAGDHNAQAIVSAGHGARVARTLIADYRRERGYPEPVADYWDWLRREAERDEEWTDRDRLREWFDGRIPDDCETDEDRLVEIRETEIDRRLDAYVSETEIERRSERGQRRLLEHVDDDVIRAYLDDGAAADD